MSVSAHLAAISTEHHEVDARSPASIREAVAAAAEKGFGLVELDLPIGKLALPRDLVERAILARVTRGPNARPLLFVRGHRGGAVPVKNERALDRVVTLLEPFAGSPLVAAAAAALADRGPLDGKSLLREARSRRAGGASTGDAAELAKAVVRAWNDGLVRLD